MLGEIIHAIFSSSMFVKYGLLGLFLNGVFSSLTPIPAAITTMALLSGGVRPLDVFIVLTVGSTIGGYIGYYLGYSGRLIGKFRKTTPKYEQKSLNVMNKYGWHTIIFLSPWLPIIGDVVLVIAGIKKYNIIKYSIMMSTGKIVKSIAVVFFGVNFLHWLSHILHPIVGNMFSF